MASRRGRVVFGGVVALALSFPQRFDPHEAIASADAPRDPIAPPDDAAQSRQLEQGPMVHVFQTSSLPGLPHYVNDHSFVQDHRGRWHLFGIYHREPIGEDTELELVHAITEEPEPSRWSEGAFRAAPAPFTIALRAEGAIGETHLWAPHVVAVEDRWVMTYQGGGPDGDRASLRIAESDDLDRWTRVGSTPLFEDICVARDPMLVREPRVSAWALYYTRCDSVDRRVSGVAYRLSRDLAHWSEPRMAFTATGTPPLPNSGYTESPFVFTHDGYSFLSVTAYPIAWDATLLYRSPAPFAFPSEPFARLRAHAAEWVVAPKSGDLFVSHAGPGQGGVFIAPVTGFGAARRQP